MKNLYLLLTSSFLVCSLLISVALAQPGVTFAPNQLIVKIQDEIPIELNARQGILNNPSIDAFTKSLAVTEIEPLIPGIPQVPTVNAPDPERLLVLHFPASTNVTTLIDPLMATGWFDYVELNHIGHGGGVQQTVPNDGFYGNQWYLENDGTYNGLAVVDADIDMERAWDYTQGDNTIVACILDSGFKLDHPEVTGRVWTNDGDNNANGSDDDGNGYTDDFQGWDFVNSDNDPTDDHGHGTNVAGILGASGNNSIGYAGVDWNCKLMFGKILNSQNSGFYSWWISAIYYAVDNGADVINMSVGGSSFSAGMRDAIDYAHANNVVVVACMMNFDNSTPYYPANYTNTIAVGATDVDDERVDPFFWSSSSGSNYGPHIDLCAPGNFINGLSYTSNTNYNSYWGGTSQATPMVAGVASLMKALDPSLSPDSIRTILRATAQDQVGRSTEDVPGFDNYHGAGRLNAYAAISYITNRTQISICQGDDYEGYTASGIYVDYLPTGDSVRIVELTVSPQIQTSFEETICKGETLEGFDSTGIYISVFTAAGGCDSVRTLTLTVLDEIASTGANIVADDGSGSGSISPSISGGQGPYTYMWDNGETSLNLTNLFAGTYTLTVTDDAGCTESFTFEVEGPATHIADVSTEIKLFPNPVSAGSQLSLEISASLSSMQKLWLVDKLGRTVQEFALPNSATEKLELQLKPELPAGVYLLKGQTRQRTVALGSLMVR